ncbi:MAG: HEAT repeat domain-containing protein [Planctomycetota bacterium]|jgi:hypothetical protein
MSGTAHDKTDGIELHFCRDCGISIPIPDIENGSANPALPGCAYALERCANRRDAPAPDDGGFGVAPVGAGGPRGTRSAAESSGRDGGMRLVAAVALLYVVGTTTFLLFREVFRPPPEIVMPTDVALVRDIHNLDRKFEAADKAERTALDQLKSNDSLQATTLSSLRERLKELVTAMEKNESAARQRDLELSRGLLALTEEAMGLKTPIGDIMERLDEISGGTGTGNSGRSKDTDSDKPKKGEPDKSKKDKGPADDPKVRAQANAFIKQLTDRSASDQTRYNAAVQLGDLGHPAAVEPLVRALQEDPYDLVRRAAAFSLGMLGKHSISAVPVLIEGVGKQEEYVGYMCARALGEISKATLGRMQEFGYDPTMNRKQRRKVMESWNEWWQKNKALIQTSSVK